MTMALPLVPGCRLPRATAHSSARIPPRLVAKHAFGVDDVDEASGVVRGMSRTMKRLRGRRQFRACCGIRPDHRRHAANATPAKRMAFGPPSQFSMGTTPGRPAPRPADRPHRGAESRVSRANTTENNNPVRKKGTAAAR